MPNYRRARTSGGAYFFTVVTYHRQPILCRDESIETMKDVVKNVMTSHPFDVDAWVTLPDHIHCLWTLPEGDSDYSTRWALIKKEFTKRTRGSLELRANPTLSRIRHREAAVWQRRFWEHQIRDETDHAAHMDYIHFNPVKHGLVESPIDWPHSTFQVCIEQGRYEKDWGCGDIEMGDNVGHE